jgi:hypothetical protein
MFSLTCGIYIFFYKGRESRRETGKKRSSGKGRRERVMRGKYGQSTLCTHMKMS